MNTKDNRWLTPLHRACASKASSVVEVLLGHQVKLEFLKGGTGTGLNLSLRIFFL